MANIMLMVSDYGKNPTQEGFDAIYKKYLADCDQAALSAQEPKGEAATHRHKKRGTTYALVGTGKMQTENWVQEVLGADEDGRNAWVKQTVDMSEVAIYRSTDDGSLWVRPREEFEDGRFEALSTTKEESDVHHRRNRRAL